jgi:hypothetical protein
MLDPIKSPPLTFCHTAMNFKDFSWSIKPDLTWLLFASLTSPISSFYSLPPCYAKNKLNAFLSQDIFWLCMCIAILLYLKCSFSDILWLTLQYHSVVSLNVTLKSSCPSISPHLVTTLFTTPYPALLVFTELIII